MPIRVRLAALCVTLVLVALTVVGLFTYVVASSRIYDAVDETLRVQAETIAGVLEGQESSLSPAIIEAKRGELEEAAAANLRFQIRGADGAVLYRSSQSASASLPAGNGGGAHLETAEVLGQDVRIVYLPIEAGDQALGTVEVAESLRASDRALAEIRDIFVLGGLVAAVVVSIAAYTLAGRALVPVTRVSDLARDIEATSRFERRLAVPHAKDEVSELVRTFNAMIDRVEQMLILQKSFLAESSHELRRPLTVMRTNLDILGNPAVSDEDKRLCLAEMQAEAQAMSRLIADLLLLTRDQSQSFERDSVDVSAVCMEAVDWLRSHDDTRVVGAEIADEVTVNGDRLRIGQAVSNLVENAALYTPAAGRIEISLASVDGMARIEVSDSGIGIDSEDLPHVFERFYRGQAARASHSDGSGLGLAIVKYVVEAHGGRVSVTSATDLGSTFVIELPLPTSNL